MLAHFERLLQCCIEQGASDLHLSSGEVPFLRRHGQLGPAGEERLARADLEQIAAALMHERQRVVFAEQHTLDMAYSLPDGTRFRINIFRERGQVAMAIRRLENTFKSLDEWHLPPQLAEFADLRDGLVLVTGPTGSGKTTTLATLLHRINQTRSAHVVTIEDPVEYVHRNLGCLIHQRELHTDVPSFAEAVRAALREDPDVILVGEMRDPETIRAAITAAETGHLVFSTLHTGDAVGAIDRMLGVFSAEEQPSLRHQLAMVLRAVMTQRLLPSLEGDGRYPAVEILKVTTAVSHLIRTGKPHQIYAAMETGADLGMQTLEHSLAELVAGRCVALESAQRLARDERIFQQRLQLAQQNSRTSTRTPARRSLADNSRPALEF